MTYLRFYICRTIIAASALFFSCEYSFADNHCEAVRKEKGVLAYLDCAKGAKKGSSNSLETQYENLMDSKKPLAPTQEAAVDAFSIAFQFGDTVAQCVAAYDRQLGYIADARAFERMSEKYLSPLGAAFKAIKINNKINKGEYADAAFATADQAMDMVICYKKSPVCLSWMVGKTIGELANFGPKVFGADRTVNEWWNDQIAELMHPSPTEEDFRRFEAATKAKILQNKKMAEQVIKCSNK